MKHTYKCPKCGKPFATMVDPKYITTPTCVNNNDDTKYRPYHSKPINMILEKT